MRVLTVTYTLLGAALLLLAGGWAVEFKPLWAFSFLLFVPLWLRSVCVLLLVLVAFNVLRLPLWARPSPLAPHYFFPLLAGLIFWLGREQTWHGDALLKLELLRTQTLQSDPYVWKEPLDSLLAYSVTGWLRLLGQPPEIAIALLSVLAGMVYVAAVFYVDRSLSFLPDIDQPPPNLPQTRGGTVKGQKKIRLLSNQWLPPSLPELAEGGRGGVGWAPTNPKSKIQNPKLLLALLALGSSQLWFGHVENYSLVTAATFAAIALAVGYLAGRAPLWAVGLVSGLAVSFHPQAAFALPALLLLLTRTQWPRQLLTLLGGGLVAPLLTGLALYGVGAPLPDFTNGYAGDPQVFLTPAQMMSANQLLDAFNNLWLIAPLTPLLLVSGLWGWTQPALRADRTFRYLTGVALGLLAYHFSFQNDLPRWRDWDLFAMVAPGFTLWGVYPWTRFHAPRGNGVPTLRVAVRSTGDAERPNLHSHAERGNEPNVCLWPPLLFAALFTLAWIGVNHHFVLIHPNADQRAIYERYRLLDLTTTLPRATISPAAPICAAATGCERVKLTAFAMPEDGDSRPTIFAHAPARIELPLTVPEQASFLWLSPALEPEARGWGGDGVTFAVVVSANGQETTLWSRHLAPDQPADLDWQTVFVPLDDFSGQTITLILATTPGPANNDAADRAGWGLPWLMQGTVDGRFGE